jgi:inorganic triphosphatase YgiF
MASEEREELEIVLMVRSNGERILSDLASLQSILTYRLKHLPRRIIHDTYYDTPDRILRKKRVNLRMRNIGEQWFLSAKLGSRMKRGGVISRRETETPWSTPALRQIASQLGLRLPDTSGGPRPDPKSELGRMGLQMVQSRETRREGSNVIKDENLVAELALDTVIFHFNSIQVPLYEIEVELKSDSKTALKALDDVAKRIISMYPGLVSPWPYGKFVTGRAIEKLQQEGRLQDLLDGQGLKPDAINTIERVIHSKNLWK